MIDGFSFPTKKQGDRVYVACVVSGDLPLNISWRKDDQPLLSRDMGVNIKVSRRLNPVRLKGLAQAKIIKKSLILFWLLNMTI